MTENLQSESIPHEILPKEPFDLPMNNLKSSPKNEDSEKRINNSIAESEQVVDSAQSNPETNANEDIIAPQLPSQNSEIIEKNSPVNKLNSSTSLTTHQLASLPKLEVTDHDNVSEAETVVLNEDEEKETSLVGSVSVTEDLGDSSAIGRTILVNNSVEPQMENTANITIVSPSLKESDFESEEKATNDNNGLIETNHDSKLEESSEQEEEEDEESNIEKTEDSDHQIPQRGGTLEAPRKGGPRTGVGSRKRKRATVSRKWSTNSESKTKKVALETSQEESDREIADRRSASEQAHEADDEKAIKRKEAFDALLNIETEFTFLRNRLYGKKLLKLNEHEEMIQNETHERFNACIGLITERRDDRVRLATENLMKQLGNIKNVMDYVTKQRKYQLLFDKRRIRQALLTKIATKCFQLLNKQKSVHDPTYITQKTMSYRQSALLQKQRIEYEAAVLCELNSFAGFPTAPIIETASFDDIRNDLLEMGCLNENQD